MEPLYQPKTVEQRWQRTWEEEGLYEAHPESTAETYVIMHPPPNISGSLSIGHALQLALEDTLVRWHRMRGFDTLFQPGYDHGGISTWAAIGWFVHLYERGWIYQASRIVNWCPRDRTALSDLEVEHQETDDTLSYVRYPLADGSGHVTIATVRPATILADVAVAVHPADERYHSLVGKEAIVPFVERPVPVIADERVDPEFGTGALKVTPGHDPVDFELGRDHDLPELTVIGLDGRMNEEAGELAGLAQEEAGERVLAWARERGLLEQQEPYRHG